ncbi:hypothetical protein BS47DRAFT_1120016 [Hydnum rufescens UP504]|uniref:F-box domain-containing protein n=1 Tax=Hydnum rufescens UP504 TaxID=1448309 RepID=A0A9P6ATZ3_9AGAM|nr:hypothetical protein BS47DRAFT_1120016 [Hydnum rufescens UP504]
MTLSPCEFQRLRDVIDGGLAALDPSTPKNAMHLVNSRLGGAPALATMDAKLYCLEREMDILARVQESVAKERDELYCARQRAHNAQLAINRLPREILCAIFMEIGASVGHICNLWREITLNMPQLWRDIHLTITPDGPASSEMVSTWIQWSRSVLLDFTVVLLGVPRSGLNANILFFKEHLPLCRSLTITHKRFNFRADVSDWSFLLSVPMPLLCSLDLDAPAIHPGDSSPELVIALASFPRLRSLSVSVVAHAPSISFGEFFSPYLTAITLAIPLRISELSRLTAGSPVLRSLTLMCTNHWINDDDNLTITLPPSTIELTLIGQWSIFYLAKFTGPNVHTLSLSPLIHGSEYDDIAAGAYRDIPDSSKVRSPVPSHCPAVIHPLFATRAWRNWKLRSRPSGI